MWWKTLLIVAGVSVLVWAAVMLILSFTASRPADLGVTAGRLRPCPSTPNCVCSQDDGAAAIAALAFEGDPAEAWRRVKAVLAAYPRTTVVTATDGYIHAECTSLLFRFVDDVELLLDAAGKRIHVRSGSRVGRSDLGVNRARVESLRAAFGAAQSM